MWKRANLKPAAMLKKANQSEQFNNRTPSLGYRFKKSKTSKPNRADVSAGSARMADGAGPGQPEVMKKERLLMSFRMWEAEGKLGPQVRCPICKLAVNVENFDRHVRRTH
jgi:hypothetical protein